MSRRELLTEDERAQLFGVPVDEASLARRYTLSPMTWSICSPSAGPQYPRHGSAARATAPSRLRLRSDEVVHQQRKPVEALAHVGVAGRQPRARAGGECNHRRSTALMTRMSASTSTFRSTITRTPLASTISYRLRLAKANVLFEFKHTYPGVVIKITKDVAGSVGRSVIADKQFEISQGLIAHRLDALLQPRPTIVYWQDYADLRRHEASLSYSRRCGSF